MVMILFYNLIFKQLLSVYHTSSIFSITICFSLVFNFPAKVLFLGAALFDEIPVEIANLVVLLRKVFLNEAFSLWMLIMHLTILINVECTLEVPPSGQFFSAKVRLLNLGQLLLGEILNLQKSTLFRNLRLTHLEQLSHHLFLVVFERAGSVDHEAELFLGESFFCVFQGFEGHF